MLPLVRQLFNLLELLTFMPKIKTNKSASKRFKKTGSGKIKRGSAFRRHLLTDKTKARKRRLRAPAYVSPANEKAVSKMIPY